MNERRAYFFFFISLLRQVVSQEEEAKCCWLGLESDEVAFGHEERLLKRAKLLKIANEQPMHILSRIAQKNIDTREENCDVWCHYWTSKRAFETSEKVQEFDALLIQTSEAAKQRSRKEALPAALVGALNMESSIYYPGLKRLHQVYDATLLTSLRSTIPVPYLRRSSIRRWGRAPIAFANATALEPFLKGQKNSTVFIAKNCASRNNRESIVRNLSSLLLQKGAGGLDCPSRCPPSHNKKAWPQCTTEKPCTKRRVMMRYPFYLAFENSIDQDYVTEKVYDALEAGVLPIYFGAPNIDDFVPPHSIIKLTDFPSLPDLAQYLASLLQNSSKYLQYFAWKQSNLPLSFRKRFEFIREGHSYCRFCRWVHAKKRGWAWDHASQHFDPPPPPDPLQ